VSGAFGALATLEYLFYTWFMRDVDDGERSMIGAARPLDALEYAPPIPDALDLVVEAAALRAISAAQQYERIESMRREALADAAARFGRKPNDFDERSARLELANALRITEVAADDLLRTADALVNRYPTVLDSLSHASITESHARILVDGLDEVEPDLADDVIPRAIALAEHEPVGTFRRRLRKLIESVRFQTLADRHSSAVQNRRAYVETCPNGMGNLTVHAPIVELRAIFDRATAAAKVIVASPDETRTLDQVRADVVCDLLIDGRTDLHPEQARGVRATVVVTVPALALVDDERIADNAAATQPPVVEGIGPVSLEVARSLVGTSPTMMRVLTHPVQGMVLSVSRDRYETPPSLRRLVTWRAERCLAPGCGVPAWRCDIDHSVAWEDGGETALSNLAPLCRGHHTIKHRGDWSVRQLEGTGGALEWISPMGRRYVVEPERRVPVFRPSEPARSFAPF
jgi:hypothetical protein